MDKCPVCNGIGIVSTGGWHFDGEPWDDIEDYPCPVCHGTGRKPWPVAWLWQQVHRWLPRLRDDEIL